MGEFRSEAQRRLFHAKEERGELSPKEVSKWERETPKAKKKRLPMHVKKSYDMGSNDALTTFGVKVADLPPLGIPHGVSGAIVEPATGAPTLGNRASGFAGRQFGAAKDLAGNLYRGLGGAATPEAGMAARGAVMGNLKTLAPSLLAGGALYMMHRHNQAQRDAEARQRAMMMGSYPGM
jgi:hypothetical protein